MIEEMIIFISLGLFSGLIAGLFGIAGTTTAYALLKKGYRVTIIDSRRYPAMATSYANGGQLSASNA